MKGHPSFLIIFIGYCFGKDDFHVVPDQFSGYLQFCASHCSTFDKSP
jgi:hypothetical protein